MKVLLLVTTAVAVFLGAEATLRSTLNRFSTSAEGWGAVA